MSRWKKISLSILAVLFLLTGSIALLIGTAPGLHILFQAANRWVPGLHIGEARGGWQDLTLQNIDYQHTGVTVKAGKVHLSLSLRCLLSRSLCVNDIALADISVTVDTKAMPPSTPEKAEQSGPLNLSTPYPLTLRHVSLDNIHVMVDSTAIDVGHFHSGLTWIGQDMTLLPTALRHVQIALPKTEPERGKVAIPEPIAAGDSQSLGEQLAALFAKPFLPDMADFSLPLNLDITGFHGTDIALSGDTALQVSSVKLKARIHDNNVMLETLDLDSSMGSLVAKGTAVLNQNWPVDLTLKSTLNNAFIKEQNIQLKVGGALRDTLTVSLGLTGPVSLNLNAQTELAQVGLPLHLEVSSSHLFWPLEGPAAYQADDIAVKFTGKMTDYALSLRGAFRGQDLPSGSLLLEGKGNTQQFTLNQLQLNALEGQAALTGIVDWSKAISWRSNLILSKLNTAQQYPEWPARLDGQIQTRGSFYGGSWQVEIPHMALAGNIKKNKVRLEGQLRGNNYMQWSIPGVNLQLGRNTAKIAGDFGVKDLKLDTVINAPALDNILPGLGGMVTGNLNVRGEVSKPQLVSNITARKLHFQALTINSASLKGEISSGEQIGGDLTLRVDGLRQDTINLSHILLQAKGNEHAHTAQLSVTGSPVSGQMTLSGHFDRATQRWQGVLSHTRFNTPVGPWSLSRDMTLDFHSLTRQLAVGPHCWLNPDAEICMSQTINLGPKGNAVVNLNRVDLAMLKPIMPEDTQVKGIFTGKADFAWDTTASGLPQGTLTLNGRGVQLNQGINGKSLPLAFDALSLTAQLKNNQAQLGWLLRLAGGGQFDGQVRVTDPQGRRNLAGNIRLDNLSLARLNALFSQGEKAQGLLSANLRLGGNAQQPRLFGQMRLNQVDIEGNFMPFEMEPSQIGVQFNGTRSVLQGALRTKQGQIVLQGDADWTHLNNWQARIAARGDNVRITVPPMVRLDVSPDVEFVATPSQYSLNGQVDIPWARIVVHDLPDSAVGVSSDEVMLNEKLQPIQPKANSVPINSNLRVHLGDNVRLDAFGLKARLSGDLSIMQDKQGLGLNGQINIPEGRFSAYGQDLIVRKGELLFSGPPEQPYINLEAIRNPDATENNVVAGVRVTGLAPEPKAEIFSDPTMSQQEALSYLLRGQGLSASGSDGDVMTSMLVGLGVAQSGQIVGKIGETFGVSNLSLDTAGVGDSSQVVVSGYVLPGLQVKYGVGIFDSLATLTLRYRLMPKLYLEAVSGINQALDLLYQFEF